MGHFGSLPKQTAGQELALPYAYTVRVNAMASFEVVLFCLRGDSEQVKAQPARRIFPSQQEDSLHILHRFRSWLVNTSTSRS